MRSTQEFQGTPRFRIIRKLGQGGMGVVYEADDEDRRIRVALKTLQFATPLALGRFKREFRSISNIVHPNLVSLYELFAQEEPWFYTMEFLQGTDFITSAWASSATSWQASSDPTLTAPSSSQQEPTLSHSSVQVLPEGFTSMASARPLQPASDHVRLRTLLRQVAEGLCAVHKAGKLHRDLKSSNVLVTTEDRAVVLDFGLAADLDEASNESVSGEVVGTVPYMSPEQLAARRLTSASDWYSFGVMLYEALTGNRPFAGSGSDALRKRLHSEPPPPHDLNANVPEDLSRLCSELLRIDPQARPSGEEILARLNARSREPRDPSPRARFVGRKPEQELLAKALALCDAGTPAVVLVHGKSGIGKSTLLENFLQQRELKDALVLRSRCYEQESIAYKAFDTAADSLCQHLRSRGDETFNLLPADIAPLLQIFPVFRQLVEPTAKVQQPRGEGDTQELRRRAFSSFRELFQRLRQKSRVILCLDDLQWGDLESEQLLNALLAPPDAPGLLVLCSFRSEYEQRSEFLKRLLDHNANSGYQLFDIPLQPLAESECVELAATLLGRRASDRAQRAQRIAEESSGNPYFLTELARLSADDSGQRLGGRYSSLESLISERVSELPEAAQQLLRTVVVFGQPIAQIDAYEAAGFKARDPGPLSQLRFHHLVRSEGGLDLHQLEPFHDRVRETVLKEITPEDRRRLHGSLAATLERSGRAEPETLASQWEGAGDLDKAIVLYESAADQASASLAFDHSAELFARVLQLRDHPREKAAMLREKLARALADAGRGARAAEEFQRAAELSAGAQQLAFERDAAFHYCSSGHLQEGMAVLDRVLKRVGLRRSQNKKLAALKFLFHCVQLHLRGVEFQTRPAEKVSAKLLEQFDAAWTVAAPMVQVDLLQSLDFGTRCLVLALRTGDPKRLIQATHVGGYLISVQGKRGRRLAERLADQSQRYAAQFGEPRLRAAAVLAHVGISYISAEWRACCRYAMEAEQILSGECTGTRWELSTVWTLYLYSLWTLGEFAELAQRIPAILQTAEDREDLYSYANLEVFCTPMVLLAADQPQEARAAVAKGMQRWRYEGFHLQHVMASHSQIWADLYQGRGAHCVEQVQKTWRLLKENAFHNHPNLHIIWQDLLARSAFCVAASNDFPQKERSAALKAGEKIARKLAASRFPWGRATGTALCGGAAALRGERERGAYLLLQAAEQFAGHDMAGYAACARRCAGQLLGGEQGEHLIRDADGWMRTQNIVNPQRMAAAQVGGYLELQQ